MTFLIAAPLTDSEHKRRWYEANREAVKEYNRLYRAANREALIESNRVWRAANHEAVNERKRLWRAANPEAVNEPRRSHYAANREAVNERRRIYCEAHPEVALTGRSKRRGAVIVEVVDPRVLFERDDGKCHICSEPVDPDRWDVDHIVPIKAGGVHSYANTAVSHPSCNRSKRAS